MKGAEHLKRLLITQQQISCFIFKHNLISNLSVEKVKGKVGSTSSNRSEVFSLFGEYTYSGV